jgi:hypothetical protein
MMTTHAPQLEAGTGTAPRARRPGLRAWVWLGALLAGLACPSRAQAATASIITNFAEITNPQIDATSYINLNRINAVDTSFGLFLFQTINNLNFTNAISGTMIGDVGFDLQFVTNTSRFYANAIVNQGVMRGETILLSATNLVNSGELRAGATGLLQLQGQNVNISRSVLSASDTSGISLTGTGFRFVDTNGVVTYENPSAVTDLYWGAGTGNVMSVFSGVGFGLFLPQLDFPGFGFRPPTISSPSHEVESVFGGLGSFSTLVSLFGTNYAAHVRTNTQGTNLTIQVVLVQTNTANTNLAVDVRFASFGGANFFPGNTPIVRFSTFGSDITTGNFYTNSLYFFDYSNTRTTAVLSANLLTSSSRPASYELSRDPFDDIYFDPTFSFTTNENIANIAYYQFGYAVDTVTNNPYAAYQAAVGNAAFTPGTASFVPHLDDPTNFPGRVEINADNLNMSLARIRADNLVSIRATNLVGFNGTLIDAPYVQLAIANQLDTHAHQLRFHPGRAAQRHPLLLQHELDEFRHQRHAAVESALPRADRGRLAAHRRHAGHAAGVLRARHQRHHQQRPQHRAGHSGGLAGGDVQRLQLPEPALAHGHQSHVRQLPERQFLHQLGGHQRAVPMRAGQRPRHAHRRRGQPGHVHGQQHFHPRHRV